MAQKAPAQNLELRPDEEPSPQRLAELFRGIQQNFDALYSLFPLQGGDVAGSIIKAISGTGHKVNFGEVSMTWSASKASAKVEVEHGLGKTPKVFLQLEDSLAPFTGGLSLDANLVSRSSTKFVIGGSCSESISLTIPCLWLAIV